MSKRRVRAFKMPYRSRSDRSKEIVRAMRAFPDEEIDELFAPLTMTDWTQSSKLLSGEKTNEM